MPIPVPHRKVIGPLLPIPADDFLVGVVSVTREGDVAIAMERAFTKNLTKEQASDLVAVFADYLNREMTE